MAQIYIFALSCTLGFLLSTLYDFSRIVGLFFNYNSYNLLFHDLFYFIFSGLLTFLFILYTNFGEIRFYILFGEIIGLIVYFVTFRRIVNKLTYNIYKIVILIYKQTFKKFLFSFVNSMRNCRLFCIKTKKKIEK